MSTLERRVLVLNKSWIPVNVTTVKRAMCLLYADLARVVDAKTYETYGFQRWCREGVAKAFIKSVTMDIPVPEVIVLMSYNGVKVKQDTTFSRSKLLKRDNYTCQYCGEKLTGPNLTIDHILPRSRGGQTSWTNCVLACYRCNIKKDDKTPEEAKMKLLCKPGIPSWSIRVLYDTDAWSKFLSNKG